MTLKDALAQLKSLGDEKVRARNKKNGAGDNQFGVPLGDIRKLAAKISLATTWIGWSGPPASHNLRTG